MKKTAYALISFSLLAFLACGCASGSFNLRSLAGINIADLEKARDKGKIKTVSLPYDTAFDKVLEILEKNKLTAFRKNRRKGYIIAIGFPKQETTTRVGIFFARLDDKNTEITLSSLSSTCLSKAENIIFGELEK
ncbi:MAG: hypothetical protein U9R44_07315 [Candidatus Omnitrophota bacterium]|nr:hypothetical protein [Candidatus Omnitrophota bacterium]